MGKARIGLNKLLLIAFAITGASSLACAQSVSLRDIKITLTPFIGVSQWHQGYLEYRIDITNSSSANTRRVKVTLPAERESGPLVSATYWVNPMSTLNQRFYLPCLYSWRGKSMLVNIDGKNYTVELSLPEYSAESSSVSQNALILISRRVSGTWSERVARALGTYSSNSAQIIRSTFEVKDWSSIPLAYSSCNCVVVTARDIQDITPAVASGLRGYVRGGGRLVILGMSFVPEKLFGSSADHAAKSTLTYGLGKCRVIEDEKTAIPRKFIMGPPPSRSILLIETYFPFTPSKASMVMPMLFILGGYVTGLVVLVLLMWKLRKRPWLIWILPSISILTIGGLLVCMSFSESLQNTYRMTSITVLDQEHNEATTVGMLGVYFPIRVKDMWFSTQAELAHVGANHLAPGCYVNWNNGQVLWGFVEARKPGYFKICKSAATDRGIDLECSPTGEYTVTNRFNTTIKFLAIKLKAGSYLVAENIAPGSKIVPALQPTVSDGFNEEVKNTRKILVRYWSRLKYIKHFDYIATMKTSPFVSNGIGNSKGVDCESVVFGSLNK